MSLTSGRRVARSFAVMAVVLVAAFGLSACAGLPPGVDGDLTNSWPAMAQAKVSVPASGVCYHETTTGNAVGDEITVPCTGVHLTETVFVGAFTGADADRSSRPADGTPALANAYSQCRKGATDYLGDDFKMGMLDLDLVLPTGNAWTGGARWFRCDIDRYTDLDYSQLDDNASTSAKDGLRGARPLGVTCLIVTDDGKDSITGQKPIDCAQPHNGELAGLYTAPDVPLPTDKTAAENMASKGCEAVVAKFLGLPGTAVDNPVLGWGYGNFSAERWQLGDRTVRCTALGFKGNSVNGARFTGSVKGIGTRAPKS